MSREEFARTSLETNLFFQRIMKEHLYLIEANLQPVVPNLIAKARAYKQKFEGLLGDTVYYANKVISEDSIKSNEFVTTYTLRAEEVTSKLTGVAADTNITKAELQLVSDPHYDYREWDKIASDLNTKSMDLLVEVIAFQKKLITMSLKCEIFITLYDEMLEHDTREAEYYLEILKSLQNGKLPRKTLYEELNFWNNIMGEHAQFIDGMLDPTERALKDKAEDFVEKFENLVKETIISAEKQILQASIKATEGIKNYKAAATIGLLQCEIKSIIPPILADHVLREANHYARLLRILHP